MTGDRVNLPGMLGRHPKMLEVCDLVRRVAPSDLSVLVVGETGTGKELVARALHELSPRRRGPFRAVNCAALPVDRAEADLFGWERGAFTGAMRRTPGHLEKAAGGTLFLDEADSLPLAVQAKLLRAIERKEVERLGGHGLVHCDFRTVVAIKAPLDQLVREGLVRNDFAYRVALVTITLPPLRERGGDVALLARHFLEAHRNGHPPKGLSADALELLRRHRWPGNVRELQSVTQRIVLVEDAAVITPAELRRHLKVDRGVLDDADQLFELLCLHRGNVTVTAETLGVSRATLNRRLTAYGIVPAHARP